MKKISKWVFIASGIFLFILCGVIDSCNAEKPKDTDKDQVDPNVIFTQVASTIIAGVTQTAQAIITSTPAVTPTPEASATVDPNIFILEYAKRKQLQSELCGQTMGAMEFSFTYLSENPSALLNQASMDNVYKILDDFDLYCTNFHEDNVPAQFVTANDYLISADSEFQAFVDSARYGLQNIDVASITAATQNMANGGNFLMLATEEFNKFAQP